MLSNHWFPVFGTVTHFLENTKIPNIYGKLTAVQINKGINVPTRCEQNTNAMNLTLVFDRIADVLGLDPTEVALKNDGAEGHDMEWLNEHKAEMGFPVRDSLRECIEKGKAAIGWNRNWHAPGRRNCPTAGCTAWDSPGRMNGKIPRDRAKQVYASRERTGPQPFFRARADCGLNAETAYCQVAADELGMRIEDVHFVNQIDAGFYAMTPDSSTNMSVNGYAVRNAARLLKQKILEAAIGPRGVTSRGSFPPAFPGYKPEDLDIKDSVVFVKRILP